MVFAVRMLTCEDTFAHALRRVTVITMATKISLLSSAPLLVVMFSLAVPGSALAGCNSSAGAGVDWSGCRKMNKYLQETDLSGANFERTNLSRSNLKASKLVKAKMHKADLSKTVLRDAILTEADLSGVVGMRAYMDRAQLKSADLTKAELFRANLNSADLSGANLTGTQLGRAILSGAKLDNATANFANLARADLRGASLDGTDFTQAYFYRTKLEGVDLSRTKGLKREQLELSCGNDETKLPPGVDRPVSWPCSTG